MQNAELAGQLVDRCLRRGADAAEVFLQTARELSVEVRNGEVETIQESSSHGAGFRVFTRGKMAFSHSNDLTDDSLNEAIESAVDFARHMTPDEYNVLPADEGSTEVEGLYDPSIAEIQMERKIEMIREVEELAMQDRRITKSAGAGYGEGEAEVFLANSNGILKSYRESACGFGVSVVAEKASLTC